MIFLELSEFIFQCYLECVNLRLFYGSILRFFCFFVFFAFFFVCFFTSDYFHQLHCNNVGKSLTSHIQI